MLLKHNSKLSVTLQCEFPGGSSVCLWMRKFHPVLFFVRLYGKFLHGWGGLCHGKPCGGHQQVECGGCVWLHKQPGRMCRILPGEDMGGAGRREEGTEARGRLTSWSSDTITFHYFPRRNGFLRFAFESLWMRPRVGLV